MDIKLIKEKSEKINYEIGYIDSKKFSFELDKIEAGGSLLILYFFMIEKELNLIHKMKMAIHKETFVTACYFSFYNPFKKETVVNLSHNIDDFDKNIWFIPLILEYEKNLKIVDFPFDIYLKK